MAAAELPPAPFLGDRFAEGLRFASDLHRRQARKTATGEEAGVSYLGHLLGVASIVIDAGGSEDQAIAALLHDAAEDQGGTATLVRIGRDFGDGVEKIVRDCSDWLGDGEKPSWLERKQRYVRELPVKDRASRLVSLADKLYNARAIALDARTDGERVWDRFNAERAQVLSYYGALADAFCASFDGEHELALADELRATVDGLAGGEPIAPLL